MVPELCWEEPWGPVEDPVPHGTARHIVPTQHLRYWAGVSFGRAGLRSGQVSWCSSRVAYEVPVGLREHPRSGPEGAAASCPAAHRHALQTPVCLAAMPHVVDDDFPSLRVNAIDDAVASNTEAVQTLRASQLD